MEIPHLKWQVPSRDNMPPYGERVIIATKSKGLLIPFFCFAKLNNMYENHEGTVYVWVDDDLREVQYEVKLWAFVPEFKFKDEE